MQTASMLDAILNLEDVEIPAPNSNPELMDIQGQIYSRNIDRSHRFLLNIEKSQLFYDNLKEQSRPYGEITQEFVLPFNTCLFAFEKPLLIKWIGANQKEYETTRLAGILVTNEPDFSLGHGRAEDFALRIPVDAPIPTVFQMFPIVIEKFAQLLALAQNESIAETIRKHPRILSNQSVLFRYGVHEAGDPYLHHLDHYPCQDRLLCAINKNGETKYTTTKPFVCQEILARDSLVETLFDIVNHIHESVAIDKEKERKSKFKLPDWFPVQKPFGWPYTQGNLPKANYVQYLDGKHYRYKPEDIEVGSGTKHRYRYDVRRHPRIVGNKLVWINPHQRGAGKYIPKVYANRKTWFVNYFWYQAENLTKVRIVELLVIKAISLMRKLKGGGK